LYVNLYKAIGTIFLSAAVYIYDKERAFAKQAQLNMEICWKFFPDLFEFCCFYYMPFFSGSRKGNFQRIVIYGTFRLCFPFCIHWSV